MKGIVFGIVAIGIASSAVARPELNAFINKPANTVPELIAQIKTDKQVADRFMRHFSMSKAEVVDYVSTLHLGTIKKSGYFTIYSAPSNGVLKAHVSFFKKGTPAFVDAAGNPILRIKCGNPFVRGPVSVYAKSDPTVTDPNSGAVEMAVGPAPMDPASNIIASYKPTDPIRPDIAPSISLREVDNVGGYKVPQGLLGAIGLGALATFTQRGRSTTAVPEPATMIALGVGAAALLRRRKAAKK
ncbi:MAG TPA: PEP-CTERM sorting domain-containing protein [Fimbriimonas sp.]|nr:PEP-CTERM sorting domain-containing protein [Fimbriimonas sp.]